VISSWILGTFIVAFRDSARLTRKDISRHVRLILTPVREFIPDQQGKAVREIKIIMGVLNYLMITSLDLPMMTDFDCRRQTIQYSISYS
jgi:hypothetical protein